MLFSVCRFGGGTTLHWLEEGGGQGPCHPHSGLEESADLREAPTHAVASFLPLTSLSWVSLNATLLSAPTPLRPLTRPGSEGQM